MKSHPIALAILMFVVAACSGAAVSPSTAVPTSGAPPSSASAASAPPSSAPAASAPASNAAIELTVYAAASLKSAVEEGKAAYETANPGTTVVLSTDSSAALETQIEQGAPADLFLSADTTNPQELVDAGLADGAPVTFAGNELTVIVPAGNPARIASPADLARTGVRIIAAGDEVPITKYAGQLVENLAKEAGYPADFAAAYAANVESKEDNVRAVVAKIELDEGDAGIVYVTDAKASAKVVTIDVPPSANVRATYNALVINGSANPGAARSFLSWFNGPGGQAILSRLGFLPPS